MHFTQWVDRRIGHLGEALLAVIPQRAGQGGKKRGRCIVAHAPVSFFSTHERRKQNLELVFRPTAGGGDPPRRFYRRNCRRDGSVEASNAWWREPRLMAAKPL